MYCLKNWLISLTQFDITADGCWEWTGSICQAGYGQVYKGIRAYRANYESLVGPVPEGLELDHLCRNRLCVNPDHLEPVTHRENSRRAEGSAWQINATKTHCPRGHPYDEANTYATSRGGRTCRACRRVEREIA